MKYEIEQIGVLRTPYQNNAPYQPISNEEGEFRIIVDKEYEEGCYAGPPEPCVVANAFTYQSSQASIISI